VQWQKNLSAVAGLIHKLYNAKQTGEDFVAWGSGAPLRQFIFARDLARLVVCK